MHTQTQGLAGDLSLLWSRHNSMTTFWSPSDFITAWEGFQWMGFELTCLPTFLKCHWKEFSIFSLAPGSSPQTTDAIAAVTTQIYLLKLEIYILATTHVFSFGWSTCFQMRLKRYLPSTAQIRFHPIQFFVLPRRNRGEAGSYHIVDFHQGGLFWAPYKIIVKSISSYCQLHYIKFP